MYLITLAIFWLTVSLDLFVLLPTDEAWILWYGRNTQRDDSHVAAVPAKAACIECCNTAYL